MITTEQVVALLKRHRKSVVVPIMILEPEAIIDAMEKFDLRFVARTPKQSDNVEPAP